MYQKMHSDIEEHQRTFEGWFMNHAMKEWETKELQKSCEQLREKLSQIRDIVEKDIVESELNIKEDDLYKNQNELNRKKLVYSNRSSLFY